MKTITDQNIVRKLRIALNTEQQIYFSRVFIENEDSVFVCYDMFLPLDFELTILRTLRA